jgi:GNAT superfamily N-acetyltransferase
VVVTISQVRKATSVDLPRLVESIGLAFAGDPLTGWLAGGGDVLQVSRRFFEAEYSAAERFHLIYTDENCAGAAIWLPPGKQFGLRDTLVQARYLAGIIRLTRQALAQIRLFLTLEKVRPRTPHFYLRLLGVRPELQGQGLGSALMQPVLTQCDELGMPAYLETETEANVCYYEKKGFRVLREIPVQPGALTMWTMWRAGTRQSL